MNRRPGATPFVIEPLPDAPWPVVARNLLTDRENSLYKRLLSLYPDHKIFVQVALSQMIDVDRNHHECESIRAQYKQLVADFVLCGPDLGVVAVVELDDRSHERPRRQRADARKNKALADAGIRLVRIPAGALPSEDDLRELVDQHGTGHVSRDEPALRLAETVHIFPDGAPPIPRRNDKTAESRALKRVALKTMLGGIAIVGGWFFYSQFLPSAVQRALQPLAVRPVIAPAAQPRSAAAVIPVRAALLLVSSGPPAQTWADEKRAALQATAVWQQQKNRAWAAYYSAPTSCEHPVDWNAQVECGNQFMRA